METIRPKHCIIGAGGSIGSLLSGQLHEKGIQPVLAGRNPLQVNPSDIICRADARNTKEITEAIKGTEVAYLMLGLPYNTDI